MTELEMAVLDWVARAAGLPSFFLNSDPGPGCGVIQCTASDATLVAILAARARIVSVSVVKLQKQLEQRHFPDATEELDGVFQPKAHNSENFGRLIMYSSDQVNQVFHRL